MHALSILSLEKAAQKFPSELSGGMKKRVAIARALVMEPQLLLYDEPTSELDPVMGATISEIIATLREQMAVTSIVVTHDRSLALTIADRVAIIMDGRIIATGRPDEFKHATDPAITIFSIRSSTSRIPASNNWRTTMNNSQQTIRVGLFFVLGLALAWITFESLNGGHLFKQSGYTIIAGFSNLKGLKVGDDVLMAGVKIGSVGNTRLGNQRVEAVLTIQPGVKIPTDAVASVEVSSLLGSQLPRRQLRHHRRPLAARRRRDQDQGTPST
jgi:ABC-type glutathione transport system ATPase component